MSKTPATPVYGLFSLLPHGKRYRSAKSRTKGIRTSFSPQALGRLNGNANGSPDYLHCVLPPKPSFYATATLCVSYMHSHFNYTFMYILPQLVRPISAPAHWLIWLSALCPATHQPLFHDTATLCSSYMDSHFNHIYMYILPQISATNWCLYVASLLYIACLFTSLPT